MSLKVEKSAVRSHAFYMRPGDLLDRLIFWLRKRQCIKQCPHPEGSIIDLGAGYDCRLLKSLLDQYPDIRAIAVDSEFAPELTNQRLELVQADLNSPLPVRSNSVDTVVTLAVLEHLVQPDQFLSEIYRILRPGGRVILTTPGPSAQPLLEFLAYRLRVIDAHEIRDHKHYFSSTELRDGFMRAGFLPENIKAKTFIFGMNNLVVGVKAVSTSTRSVTSVHHMPVTHYLS